MADRARLLRQELPRVSIDGDPRRVSNAWEVGGEVGEEEEKCEVSSVCSGLIVVVVGPIYRRVGEKFVSCGKGKAVRAG